MIWETVSSLSTCLCWVSVAQLITAQQKLFKKKKKVKLSNETEEFFFIPLSLILKGQLLLCFSKYNLYRSAESSMGVQLKMHDVVWIVNLCYKNQKLISSVLRLLCLKNLNSFAPLGFGT